MQWDTHMHSDFSSDSDAFMESMIQSAIQKKLKGICFTDHCDLDYPEHPEMFQLDFEKYQDSVLRYATQYKSSIDVLFGVELGLQTHLAPRHKEIVSSYPFDFVIGSSHVVHGMDPYFPKFYENRSETQAYQEYFDSILENIKAFHDFDIYGHIDYVVRYGPTKNANYNWMEYKDTIDAILKELISLGKGIELNTGGFKYGLGHPNPCEEILTRYHELGGEIITIGADAHKPEHIAFDFHKVEDILKQCGFQYYTVFKQRKPFFIGI